MVDLVRVALDDDLGIASIDIDGDPLPSYLGCPLEIRIDDAVAADDHVVLTIRCELGALKLQAREVRKARSA